MIVFPPPEMRIFHKRVYIEVMRALFLRLPFSPRHDACAWIPFDQVSPGAKP